MSERKEKDAGFDLNQAEKKHKIQADNPMKTSKRLFSYFKYNKKLFYAGLLIIIVSTIIQVLSNGMLEPVINAVAVDRDYDAFVQNITLMAGMFVLVVVGQYLGSRFMAVLAHKTVYIIRDELNKKVLSLPISYYDSTSHGGIMSTFTNDVDILIQSLEQSVTSIILSAITFFGTLIMMARISIKLTSIILLFIVLMGLLMRFIARMSGKFYRRRQAMTAEMNGYVEEMISAQKVVKVFNYEDRAISAFDKNADELRLASTRASTFGVMAMPVLGNFSYLMYSAIAMTGAFDIMSATITIGALTAFLQYTRNISRPMMQVSQQLNAIFASIAGAERIFEVLDLDEEAMEGDVRLQADCEGRKSLCWSVPDGKGSYELVPVKGDVRFYDVDFGYNPGSLVLKDVSLYAEPGQKIAFVGSTGAGKTTITNLINRFYDISGGSIQVDGIDINRINKYDLRSIMSVVLQDVRLFSGTIAENIRYGRLDATDLEVVEAAKTANAHTFISKLEDGYLTEINSSGGALSQGEQQLLSIARAAVADPVILIMDEATSSVDTRTEKLISQGMDALMEGRTTFVIAHRLSTVRDADAIIVLEQGEIVERGNHDELMALQGRYYDLNVGVAELD